MLNESKAVFVATPVREHCSCRLRARDRVRHASLSPSRRWFEREASPSAFSRCVATRDPAAARFWHATGMTLAYTLQPHGMSLCQCYSRAGKVTHSRGPGDAESSFMGLGHSLANSLPECGVIHTAGQRWRRQPDWAHSRQDQSSPGDGYTHAGCVRVHPPLRVSG